jgi:HK97 family phage prohead protease
VAIEYRAVEATLDGDTLHGLVTPFNTETEIGDVTRDGFYEKVNPGAFTKTLQERDVVLIHNHQTAWPLARTSISEGAGSLSLTPDPSAGLRARAIPVQTSIGQDVLKLAKAGVVRGMSFGFEVIKDRWSDDEGRASDKYTGTHREILEVRLHEVTTTAFPAYPTTELSARDAIAAAREKRDGSATGESNAFPQVVDKPSAESTIPDVAGPDATTPDEGERAADLLALHRSLEIGL